MILRLVTHGTSPEANRFGANKECQGVLERIVEAGEFICHHEYFDNWEKAEAWQNALPDHQFTAVSKHPEYKTEGTKDCPLVIHITRITVVDARYDGHTMGFTMCRGGAYLMNDKGDTAQVVRHR